MQYNFSKFSACRCSLVVVSSKVGREKRKEKKKSLDTVLWMVSVAVACLPAAVSLLLLEALFMQISGVNLALTWSPQALFTQSSPVGEPLLQAFPFPSTLGEVTLHLLSQAGLFIYSSRGKWVFPLLLWSFPPSATFTSFPAPGCWACAAAPAFSCLACLFTALWGIPLPPLWHSGHPTFFAKCLFCSYCLLQSFSFFPWVGLGLSRGLCWSGPGLSVGGLRIA
jgi:hypothetical protein